MAEIRNSRATTGGGAATAVEPAMVARATGGANYMAANGGALDWFGPGTPLPAVAPPSVAGRQFDYPFGQNLAIRPRANDPVTFDQLRSFGDSYDLLRLVIETRKDQMEAQRWTVRPVDKKAKRTPACDEMEAFLQSPDKEHTWNTWLRMLLEDLLVLDAPCIYPRSTLGGGLYALELVDGATVKRVLDQAGRTPLPPEPAYQQVLKGLPAVDYTREELIYVPRNPRTNRVYGFSPVEQIVMTVNIALRRQVSQLEYYTSGNIPEAMIGVPETWQPDQIKQFQQWWDTVLEGNTAQRRKAIFVPGGMDPTFTKEGMLTDAMDEWLARIVCFAFSISPQPFVKMMNRATAESAAETAAEEGLAPLKQWLQNLVTFIIQRHLGHADLCFDWQRDEITDAATRAEVSKKYIDAKVLHPDEVREMDLGLEPMAPEQRESLTPAPVVGPDGKPLPPGAKAKSDSGEDPADKVEKKKLTAHLPPSTGTGQPSPSRAQRFSGQY